MKFLSTNFLIIIIFLITAFNCNSSKEDSGASSDNKMEIADVIKKHSNEIMKIDGVVGLYEGTTEEGNPCIKVMIKEDSPVIKEKIPGELEGYPVITEVTGEIRPM